MIYVLGACIALLVVSALLVTARLVKGPTSLDRMVSVDFLTSILIGGVAVLAAITRREDLLALFIALSLIGFVGSATLARFITPLQGGMGRSSAKSRENMVFGECTWRFGRKSHRIWRGPRVESPAGSPGEPTNDGRSSDPGDLYDPDAVDFSGTDVDTEDVTEVGPKHGGATAVERMEP
ncbi:monovalent cation/H+ antiporter complex subunit F [Trueperella pecoris]|nr:monovalent cation/H+ antiporter complex subunit F [Trueperella pecoris]